ncbi:MAG: hypothetical protein COA99_03860 [Moraxellaceae bacterium]|nr:MAG: hypothetical protein COA99_03860 [Moraxellaceae bacterium]
MELSKILAVDDQEENLTIISELLEGGYDVKGVVNAGACLTLIKDWMPDAFLLELNSSSVGGLELCQILKSMHPDIPVILISQRYDEGDRMAGYEAGCDEFLARPFSSWELLKKIELTLVNKKSVDEYRAKSEHATGVAMTAMTTAGEIGQALHFFRESFSTTSFSELAQKLIDVVRFYGVNAITEIKTEDEQVQRTFRGDNLSPAEQNVMDSLRGVYPIHSFGTRTAFNYRYVSLIVMNMPEDDPDKAGRLRDHIAMMVEGANSRAEMIILEQRTAAQRAMISDAVNIATDSLANIEMQQKENQDGLTQIMNTLIHDVTCAFSSLGMTEEQENNLMKLISTAEDNTNELFLKNENLSKDLKAVTLMLGVSRDL